VPVAGLLDKAYLAERSAKIALDKSLSQYEPGTPPGAAPRGEAKAGDVPGTTHFVAVDGRGQIASMTSTVEGPFGSQLLVNGYFLNNELTDFSFVPTERGAPVANRVEPGKRPLSSMAPTIVYGPDGQPIFSVGAAGGRTIIMQVAKALIARLDWGLSAQEAIAAPMLYFSGTTLQAEAGTPLAQMAIPLAQRGHMVMAVDMPRLKANAVEKTDSGWAGAADPRSEGVTLPE
ncbi:MAG TPA: gamma-glutamyltransferase, partial [Chakrabartia sp.]|nr:gamma-glutamyltransferase [Chakrabartia sp.]